MSSSAWAGSSRGSAGPSPAMSAWARRLVVDDRDDPVKPSQFSVVGVGDCDRHAGRAGGWPASAAPAAVDEDRRRLERYQTTAWRGARRGRSWRSSRIAACRGTRGRGRQGGRWSASPDGSAGLAGRRRSGGALRAWRALAGLDGRRRRDDRPRTRRAPRGPDRGAVRHRARRLGRRRRPADQVALPQLRRRARAASRGPARVSMPSASSRAPIRRPNDTKASTRACLASSRAIPWDDVPVDLDDRRPQRGDQREAGVAGAGVVDREPEPEPAQRLDLALERVDVGDRPAPRCTRA